MATITQTVEEFHHVPELKQIMTLKPKPVLIKRMKRELKPDSLKGPSVTDDIKKEVQLTNLGCSADCPDNCPYKKQNSYKTSLQVMFNALGILVAIFATFMLVTTDSTLYLIFWVCYSALRRLTRPKAVRVHAKTD